MNHPHHGGCGSTCCLRVKDLSVTLGTDRILTGVNLHIHCGQMVALIGPNGAGKSTLIKAILGQRPYEGEITFSTPGHPRDRLRIGYVPQSPAFDRSDPVTVEDLFCSAVTCRAPFLRPRRRTRETVLTGLHRVHAESLIDKRIGALSGGELQRVLLALALEPMPNLLVLDEPLSGVDVEGMALLMEMLDELRHGLDLSILMITHDFSMLSRYVDRVVLLDRRVLREGTPRDVLGSEEFRAAFHLEGGAEA